LLAVYTGSSVNSLTRVASNDDISSGTRQSRVNFSTVAGREYRVAVDGRSGATGNVVLTLNQALINDNFATGEFIGGASGSITGTTAGATKESGEPNHAGNSGGHSIWYWWTAPNNGSTTFDTIGSTFDTLLAVYTGSSVNSLTRVASNDDISSSTLQSRVTFSATASTQYKVAIDGYNGASGNTTLHWSMAAGLAPAIASSTSSSAKEAAFANQAPTLGYQFLDAGEYELAIAGLPFGRYTVEVSCDLVEWTPLATTLADSVGAAYFRDKATVLTHHEVGVNAAAGGATENRAYDPICAVPRVTAFGGTAETRTTRFYRVVAAP